MAVTYTLEEAAEKLGLPTDEFRKRLKTEWTHLRPMRDGSTLRFKDKDIDELARQIGLGTEEELQLADPSSTEKVIPKDLGTVGDSDDVPAAKPKAKANDAPLLFADDPLVVGDRDVFLVDDGRKTKVKSSSDSDVRLEKTSKPKAKPTAKKNDRDGTDEIELDILPPSTSPSGKMTSASSSTKLKGDKKGGASSGKLGKPPSGKAPAGKSGKLTSAAQESDSSEFELTLDADSSDEFELSLATDSSDEISLGDMPPPSKVGASGINLGKPIDSGINLEKKGDSGKRKGADSGLGRKSGSKLAPAKPDSDDEIEFELSLDQAGASSKKLGSGATKKPDSDSEFELTLDEGSDPGSLEGETTSLPVADEGKNDIFETDFEIPALDDDSASEAVAIDEADTDLESSDFDLAIDESDVTAEDESASQVVILDDETEEAPVKPKKKSPIKGKKKAVETEDDSDIVADDAVSFDDMELDEGLSASKALEGAKADVEEEEEVEEERVVVAQTANWGVFPALMMLPTVFVIFIGGIMAYELVHTMWGYQQATKPSTLIINKVAEAFDLQPKE